MPGRSSFTRSLVAVTALFFLSGCNIPFFKHGQPGNADSYGGTEETELFRKLLDADRESLLSAVRQIGLRTALETLCDYAASGCADGLDEPTACQLMRDMEQVAAKKDLCVSALTGKTSALISLMEDPKITFTVRPSVSLDGNDVVAKTSLQATGDIEVSLSLARKLSDTQRRAMIAHEFFHKVDWDGKQTFLADHSNVLSPYAEVQDAFNTFGASLALYARNHVGPFQLPPQVPSSIAASDLCPLITDDVTTATTSDYVLGLMVDLEGAVSRATLESRVARLENSLQGSTTPEAREQVRAVFALEIVSGDDARGRVIQGAFAAFLRRPATSDEVSQYLGVMKSATIDPYGALLTSLLTSSVFYNERGITDDLSWARAIYFGIYGDANPSVDDVQSIVDLMADPMFNTRTKLVTSFFDYDNYDPAAMDYLYGRWYTLYLNRKATDADANDFYTAFDVRKELAPLKAAVVAKQEYLSLQGPRFATYRLNHCF